MEFDFTTVNTGALPGKVHPFLEEHGITDPEIIPFSVAEMRLNLAPDILRAMRETVDRGSFGYAPPDRPRFDRALQGWMRDRHQWTPDPEAILLTEGVLSSVADAIALLTEPGDGVIVQTPLYPNLPRAVTNTGRTVVENPLKLENGRYVPDLEDLRQKAKSAKVLLLCSPHNPTGRVFTEAELQAMGRICLEEDLWVISDEIHFDLDLTRRHRVITQAVPELREKAVVCTAPSKTFNLAGCPMGIVVAENRAVRERLQTRSGFYVNTLAYAAVTAAYESGGPWLDGLKALLRENRRVLETRLLRALPEVSMPELEGTYLQWIDLGCLGLSQPELMALLDRAQVVVNDGTTFGAAGLGHIRFNLACPTRMIHGAMDRLETVLAGR